METFLLSIFVLAMDYVTQSAPVKVLSLIRKCALCLRCSTGKFCIKSVRWEFPSSLIFKWVPFLPSYWARLGQCRSVYKHFIWEKKFYYLLMVHSSASFGACKEIYLAWYLVADLRSSQAHKDSFVPEAFYLVVEVEQGKQTLDANIFSVQL